MNELLFLVAFIMGGLAALCVGAISHGSPLDDCKKTHNVYECEYIAVPKEMEE